MLRSTCCTSTKSKPGGDGATNRSRTSAPEPHGAAERAIPCPSASRVESWIVAAHADHLLGRENDHDLVARDEHRLHRRRLRDRGREPDRAGVEVEAESRGDLDGTSRRYELAVRQGGWTEFDPVPPGRRMEHWGVQEGGPARLAIGADSYRPMLVKDKVSFDGI